MSLTGRNQPYLEEEMLCCSNYYAHGASVADPGFPVWGRGRQPSTWVLFEENVEKLGPVGVRMGERASDTPFLDPPTWLIP